MEHSQQHILSWEGSTLSLDYSLNIALSIESAMEQLVVIQKPHFISDNEIK